MSSKECFLVGGRYKSSKPINLKIERAFVKNIKTDTQGRALCEAIVVMVHPPGLKVIAVGTATAVQRDFILCAGCDFDQAYRYAKAVPAQQIEALL